MRLPVETIRVSIAAACAAMAMLLPAAAGAACPIDTFAAKKQNVCRGETCTSLEPPEEIAAIARGVYSETVGRVDGLAEWIGVDLDKRQILEVKRYTGRQLGAAPLASGLNVSRRETHEGDRHWIDVTRRSFLLPSTAGDIVCSANAAWAELSKPLRGGVSGMHLGVVLVDRGTRKSIGGVGGMTSASRALHTRLEGLEAPTAPTIIMLAPAGR